MSAFFKNKFYSKSNRFKGVNRLWGEIKQEAQQEGLNRKQFIEYVKAQPSYQINMNRLRSPEYSPIIAPPDSYQADLTFFTKDFAVNNGFTCLLNIIEITTKKAYAYPLKTKEGAEVLKAFTEWFETVKKVERIEVDAGTEFVNAGFKQWCELHKITLKIYNNDKQSMAVVERFHRTLRTLLEMLDEEGTGEWKKYLDEAMEIYNDTVHTSTGEAPNKMTKDEAFEYRLKLMDRALVVNQKAPAFEAGDKVRYFINKKPFQKGLGRFSKEVYTIESVKGNSIYLEGVEKPFRNYQLQKATDNDETVLRKNTDEREDVKAYRSARRMGDLREKDEKVVDQAKKALPILQNEINNLPIAWRREPRSQYRM